MFFGFFGNNEKISLKPKHKKLLNDLVIDDTNPSTLLHDFQVMIDVFHNANHKLTSKHQIPLNIIREINPRLKNPLEIGLKRQTQNSYPPIEGLYLLLRASGLSYVQYKGKTPYLYIDDKWLNLWKPLNATEKYCYLLEAWILRANEEILGGRPNHFGVNRTFDKILSGYNKIGAKGFKVKSYKHFREEFSYFPETYNLALMDLFGMVKIHEGKPVDGDGWQVDKVERTPVGEAILAVLSDVLLNKINQQLQNLMEAPEEFIASILENEESEETDDLAKLSLPGTFMSYLQEYFPAWQQTLKPDMSEPMTGHFTFKVSLGKNWSADIILSAEQSFDTLAHAILNAVEFDSDHLYQFTYQSRFGASVEIVHPYADGFYATNELTLGTLHMRVGFKLTFVFDFGDWWEFDVLVKHHDPDAKSIKMEILNIKGDPPEQYPEWDGDDYDDDFDSFATGFDFD